MRLDPQFRRALYAAFVLLALTGVGWLFADWHKDPDGPEFWQLLAADLLMAHGGLAMMTLMLLGALVPLHVRRAWRTGRNRLTGPVMVGVNAALILTAFGLYYAGSETLRPWVSDLHIAIGLALPVLLILHVWLGRRSAVTSSSEDRGSPSAARYPSAAAPVRPPRARGGG